MKAKANHRAIISCVLAIALCLTMMTSGTIAWFTDEVTSNLNTIQAGNLDVKLEYWDGDSFEEVVADTKLFKENALWEPGYTEVAYLKVSNAGSLALKYQLGLNVGEQVTGKTKDGEDINLADHLVFKAVEIAEDKVGLTGSDARDKIVASAGTTMGLNAYNLQTKKLETTDAPHYVALAVFMPTSVGNEANHDGTNVPSIKLGVKLVATQLTAEDDSFDNQYDAGAMADFKVLNAEELMNAIKGAQDGDIIAFGADIEAADGALISNKNITIDLNGKTFTATEGANTNNRNFKINGSSKVTIQNGTLIAKGDMTSGAYGTVRTEDTAEVTLKNMKLYSYRGNGLNVKAVAGSKVTIFDSEIYAQYGGGVEAAGGTIELNNVKIEQKGVYDSSAWCSVAIGVNGGTGKVIVNSGDYSAAPIATDANAAKGTWVAYVMSSGGKLIINGGTFNGTVAETADAANACGVICADRAAEVEINGGTFNSNGAILDMRNNVGTQPNPVATLKGGTYSADPTKSGLYSSNLIKVADGYVATEKNGTWTVDVPRVSTATDLKTAFAEGGTVYLDEDVKIKVEDLQYVGGDKPATIIGGTLSRDTASGNPLLVNTTEKVTFEGVTFESVKGSAVLATRKVGANIEVNDCVFNNQAAPSTGNTGVQVFASNVTMTFNRCTFNNMPVVTNSSYPEGIKLVFNDCTFNWKGDNCSGFIQIANNLKIQVEINDCKFNYTTDSQYNTAKTMISYNWPENCTININGLEVVGTRNNDKIWKICSSNDKVTINTTGTLSYTFNGNAVDFASYLK